MAVLTTIHLSLIFGFSKCLPFRVFRPTALKLGCITNFDMLFLVMGIISTSPLCRGVATKESRDASGGRPSLLARTLLQNGAFLLLTWEPGDKNQTEPPF